MYDLRIINGLVFIEDQFIQTNIYIDREKITLISTDLLQAKESINCSGDLVIPGIIDPHTHFDLDLGFTKSKDSFYTGTKAAAFGGVTTVIDFLSPVSNAKKLINEFHKRKNEAKESVIDYKFHACLMNPKNEVENIVQALPEIGCNTVKIFTTYSDSNRRTYEPEIRELLSLTKSNQFTLTVHVENDEMITTNDKDSYLELPNNRPTESETTEALKLAKLVKETDGLLYMVHLSSGKTLDRLKSEYSDILNTQFFIESCPHYFTWNNEVLHKEDGNLYTMAPPLRSEKERKQLINSIDDVYTIGTDHCIFNKDEKDKELLKDIALGIGGVEESFRVMYTQFGESIIPKMTSNVAKAHYLYPQKGVIQEGSDADMFIYKLKNTVINQSHGNGDHNLYYNHKVNGEIITTISRGKFVVRDKEFIPNTGKLLNQIGGNDEGN